MKKQFDVKRLLSVLLALVFLFTLAPQAVFAQEGAEPIAEEVVLLEEAPAEEPPPEPALAEEPEEAPTAPAEPTEPAEPAEPPEQAETEFQAQAEPQPVGPDPNEGVLYEPGEVLVVYEQGITVQAAQAAAEEHLAAPQEPVTNQDIQGEDPVVLELEEQMTVAQAVEELNADPNVLFAQPNYIYSLQAEEMQAQAQTNDPQRTSQWYLSATNGVNAYNAWDLQTSQVAPPQAPVRVAVLDTGLDMSYDTGTGVVTTHEDLAANIDGEHAWDIVTNARLTTDRSPIAHGTHVTGIIAAAADNAIGIAGVSYNAQVVPVNVFYDSANTNDTHLIAAINYVMGIPNVKVINLSVGAQSASFNENTDKALRGKIQAARAAGIAVVCAGGNEYTENFMLPGDYPECISVVSLDSQKRRGVCGYNSYKDIAAPGVGIYSTGKYDGATSTYGYLTGTSMAAPMVSGAAALLFSQNGSLTVSGMENLLYATADDLGDPRFFGNGKLDVYEALRVGNGSLLPPTGVKAAAAGTSSIQISWNAVAGAHGYKVYRTDAAGGNYALLSGGSAVNGTSYTDSGLARNKTYYYKVVAYNSADGNSALSRAVQAVIPPIPAAPTNITVSLEGTSSLVLAWDNIPGADGYNVYRWDNGTYTWIGKSQQDSEGRSIFTDRGLMRDRVYYYRVKAYVELGDVEDESGYETVLGKIPAMLLAPVSAEVNVQADKTSALLAWAEVVGADGYDIYRSKGNEARVKLRTMEGTEYLDTGLERDTEYAYYVAAYRIMGSYREVGRMTLASVKTPGIPAAPDVIKASKIAYDGVTVSWSKSAEAKGYFVYRSTKPDKGFRLIATNSASKRSFADEKLKTGASYYYKVIPYRLEGKNKVQGDESAVLWVQPKLAKSAGIKASSAQKGVAAVSWKKVQGAGGYEVWRAVKGGMFKKVKTLSGADVVKFQNTKLKSKAVYSYKVRAWRKVGSQKVYGDYSAVKSVRIK